MTSVARENQNSRTMKNSSPSTTERLLQYTITSYHQLYNWTSTDRAIEEIEDPPTTNVAIHYYRVLKTHLAWDPTASETATKRPANKLALLRVDERGTDVYLAAVFSIINLLTKTPIRDAANNPIMEPVPPCLHRLK